MLQSGPLSFLISVKDVVQPRVAMLQFLPSFLTSCLFFFVAVAHASMHEMVKVYEKLYTGHNREFYN